MRTNRVTTFAVAALVLFAAAVTVGAAERDVVVARSSGTFEVSGSGGSYAVAWPDRGWSGDVLSVAVIDQNHATPPTRRVSEKADAGARVFLSKHFARVAIGWRERGLWHLGLFDPDSSRSWVEATLHGPATPIALSLGPDGMAVLTSPVSGEKESLYAWPPRGPEWPALAASALVKVDVARSEIQVIREFDDAFVAGTVRYREKSWTVAAVGPAADVVRYEEIDALGRVTLARRLGAAPEPGRAPDLKETSVGTMLAWVERDAGRRVARLGRIARDGAGTDSREQALGEGASLDVALAEGGSSWAAWREAEGKEQRIRVIRPEESSRALCEAAVPAAGVERFWLLDAGKSAQLLVQVRTREGASELRPRVFECRGTSEDPTASPAPDSTLPLSESSKNADPPVSILGGVEEPCDGVDNDGDGTIDEGCDQICDNHEKLGDDVQVTGSAYDSFDPSIVWTGSEYGVAWRDNRDGNDEIYFKRLDAVGTSIGSVLRVTNNTFASRSPSLVWTGTEYGMAWSDNRHGNYEIYFRRLDSAGDKVGSEVRVTTANLDSTSPSLVWTGTVYAVAWRDARDGNGEIYFVRLSSDGTRIGTEDTRVTWDSFDSSNPSLAWTGTGYGVAWNDSRDGNTEIYVATLNSVGDRINNDIRVTSDTASSVYPALVWNGSGFGLSWTDSRLGGEPYYNVYFTRLHIDGQKLSPDCMLDAFLDSSGSSLVWTGAEYGVVWRDDRNGVSGEIYFARVSNLAHPLGPSVRITNNTATSESPSLIWTGTGYAVAWDDRRVGNADIFFARVGCCDDADGDGHSECHGDCNDADAATHPGAVENCDGHDDDCDGAIDERCDGICDHPEEPGPDVQVTGSAFDSYEPSLVWTGSQYGVAWRDDRDGHDEIYFKRLDATGASIGSAIRVTDSSAPRNIQLVWTGTEYGLAWSDYRMGNYEIYFLRLTSAGSRIGTEDTRVTSATGDSTNPSLVWSGSGYAVAWRDERDGNGEIYFARLDTLGNKVGGDVPVTTDPSNSSNPSLVWTGSGYGLAWDDARNVNTEIYFAMLDSVGRKTIGDTRLTIDNVSSVYPSLVWTGQVFGLSWKRQDSYKIYFTLTSTSGENVGPNFALDSLSLVGRSTLAWTGSEFAVAWRQSLGNGEIYFARLDASGQQAGPSLRITNDPAGSYNPCLAWTGTGYGISWDDDRSGSADLFFSRVQCCDDVDGDGSNECHDCDDTLASVYPGAPQLCDGLNNTCDGIFLPPVPEDEMDHDGDGYVECTTWVGSQAGIVGGDDCDDVRPDVNPGEVDVCDWLDNNCDGLVNGWNPSCWCPSAEDYASWFEPAPSNPKYFCQFDMP